MRWAKHKGHSRVHEGMQEQFTRKLASNLKPEFALCSNAGRLFQRRGSIWKGDSSSTRQNTQRAIGRPVTSNPIGMTRPRRPTAQISRSNGQMTTLNDHCKLQSSMEFNVRHMEAFGCFINQVLVSKTSSTAQQHSTAAQQSFFSVNTTLAKKLRQPHKPNIGACMLEGSRACARCARLSQFFWPG